jgi:hypothetical protein
MEGHDEPGPERPNRAAYEAAAQISVAWDSPFAAPYPFEETP